MRDKSVYWGWRPVAFYVFISVLVAACVENHNAPTLAPTGFPPLTLTLRYYASPPPTTAPVVPQIGTPNFGIVSAALQTPRCFATVTEGLLCLGVVQNLSNRPLSEASVRIEIFSADGTLLDTQIVYVAQKVIPAGNAAPYHVLFVRPQSQQVTRIVAALYNAQLYDKDPPPVEITEISSGLIGKRYRVEAMLHNPNTRRITQLRVVVTVYDSLTASVVGYRVVTIDSLDAGASLPITLAVTPQDITPSLTHTLYAEAR